MHAKPCERIHACENPLKASMHLTHDFRCRRVRALRCAQWCAWLRRMPARPIRSCISHLRTAPSFRCVRVVVGGNTLGMSISPFVSLCHAVTHKHCLPPSLHPSFPYTAIQYSSMCTCRTHTHTHARIHTHTHTHTHTPPNKHAGPGQVVPTQTPIVDFPPPYVSLPKLVFPYPTQWLPSPAAAPRPLADTSVTICNWYVARI